MGGLLGGNTMTREEPRINALRIQQSTYGVVVPILFGTTRITGNVIDYDDFTAIPYTATKRSGKGGGIKQKETTYTYTAAVIIALCEALIEKIGQVWSGKEVVTLTDKNLALYQNQVWPYMQTNHSEKALRYKNTAYVAGVIDLGDSAEIPNLSFEVFGQNQYGAGIIDANPADVIRELLTNPRFGVYFPETYIGDLSLYSNYCVASGLFISPALTEQRECRENLTEIFDCTNSVPVWSQGKLKIIPYCDEPVHGNVHGNNVSYIPPEEPLYDLTDDDFMPDEDEEPVICIPGDASETYNIQPYEFLNRSNGYNIESDDVRDHADISNNGPRTAESIKMHLYCEKDAAKTAAQAQLQRKLFCRAKYQFKLGWKHSLLEPMDKVTLTHSLLALVKEPVRILEIEELDDQRFQVLAEECPIGVNGVTKYPSQLSSRTQMNYNVPPGNVNAPVIFEPPAELTQNGLEVWIAASGSDPNWGGCHIWISDNGESYRRLGTINGPARQGVLTAALPAGSSIDTLHSLTVDLTQSRGELLSGTQQDAQNLNTLCYVGGELIAYQTATLTGSHRYNLTYLVRGAYNTPIGAHAAGAPFARLDQAIFRYPYARDRVGKTIFLKFTSMNIFGGAVQGLDEVEPVQHTLGYTPPPDVTGITLSEDAYTLTDGTVLSDVIVVFNEPSYVIKRHFNIYYDLNNSNQWRYAGLTQSSGYRIKALPNNSIVKVKVTTVNIYDHESFGAVSASLTLNGKDDGPSVPTGFVITVGEDFEASWNLNPEPDIDFYELRLDTNVGSNTGLLAKTLAGVHKTSFLPPQRTGTAYLYAHNSSNKYSNPAAQVFNKPGPAAPLNIEVTRVFQGLLVQFDYWPANCRGANVYVNNVAHFTPNNYYRYNALSGSFDIFVVYVDSLGEGTKSGTITMEIISQVGQDLIQAGAIVAEHIAAGAINTDKLFSGSVTAEKIAAGAVTAEKISATLAQISGQLTANQISAGAINSAHISAGAINSAHISAGTISADMIYAAGYQVRASILVKGTITHGQVIPLPEGYTQDQCCWGVSAPYTNDVIVCGVNNDRVVTAYKPRYNTYDGTIIGFNWTSDTCYYWIIGVK